MAAVRDAFRRASGWTPDGCHSGETLGSQYQSISFNGCCICRVAVWSCGQMMWDLRKKKKEERKGKCGKQRGIVAPFHSDPRLNISQCIHSTATKNKSIDMISSLDHYLCSSIPKGNPTPAPVQLQLQTCYKKYSLRPGREVGICR